ncbi:asparagine synthase (glutamine-hydrolyzing) [Natrinema limicola]|uniref:Putative asparagine synthetase [glutamine-hydrolyzing] n=1 Tax=Natrinema limicola JCM 13563 TaxID=1230457 RepID=M0CDW4_9EURY|nr:asparagine synthase (glutamine-hydrolyzing) [Natrinema limicola]ELZ21461.1 asparagine synthase [Natrinema limicola JCM 13563]
MCGIAGLFSTVSPPDPAELKEMNACLSHRGPDDEGTYVDGPVGLAHKRLSIIDLGAGEQPVFNEDRSVSVIFNGEIYNYRELRQSLISAGHTFTTETDTEVLVHLYEERGASFVEHLEGMFAVALWDANSKRLLLARDPAGIKPLLMADDGHRVSFASELPAILASDLDHGGLDQTALAQYFGFGFIPAPQTAFVNISKLRPGELAIVTEDGIDCELFYEPTVTPRTPDIETAAASIRNRVASAVERRLQSDVPLGAFLSGGIDSSIVVGVLSDLLDQQVQTFTVGFEADRFDEAWAARRVADYHSTDHKEFTVTADHVRETIPEVLERIGEPFADPSLIPTYVVARETSSEVKVALSGDGADELFAGYDRYRGEFLSRYYRILPRSLRQHAIEPLVQQFPASRTTTVGEVGRLSQKFVRGGIERPSDRHFEWMRIADDAAVETIQANPVREGREELAEQHELVDDWLPSDRQDDLGAMQAVDVRFTLPNQMLSKVDAASMYNSLEVRVPFLDSDVIEYALGLPTEYKMTARERKRVLKRAFDDMLPPEILSRNKQGFDMPIGEWFKNDLADEFYSTVSTLDSEIIDVSGVMSIYREHVNDSAEHGKFLWTTYVFAKWFHRMRRENVL